MPGRKWEEKQCHENESPKKKYRLPTWRIKRKGKLPLDAEKKRATEM